MLGSIVGCCVGEGEGVMIGFAVGFGKDVAERVGAGLEESKGEKGNTAYGGAAADGSGVFISLCDCWFPCELVVIGVGVGTDHSTA